MFPSLVFTRIDHLHKRNSYDFIHLSSYFDKHYQSVKRFAKQSLCCFVLPAYVFVVVELNERTMYAYDCVRDRPLNVHAAALKLIGSFVDDYHDHHSIETKLDKDQEWKF